MTLDQIIQVARDLMEEIEDRGGGMILDIPDIPGGKPFAPVWMRFGTFAQTKGPEFQRTESKQEVVK